MSRCPNWDECSRSTASLQDISWRLSDPSAHTEPLTGRADPLDLIRFIETWDGADHHTLAEFRAGRVRTHWIRCISSHFRGLAESGRADHCPPLQGSSDDLKPRPWATLPAQVSSEGSVFHKLPEKYFQGSPDSATMALIQGEGEGA